MTENQAENADRTLRPLILETPNPLDLSLGELRILAAEIQGAFTKNGVTGVSVTVAGDEPLGAGNDWIDILTVILPSVDFVKETAYTAVVASTTVFMKSRFKRKHEARRPRVIKFYDPDGNLQGSIEIDSDEAEPRLIEPGDESQE